MPRFRKLSPPEIAAIPPTLSARAQLAQEYDALLASFAIGEYGRAELIAGERRDLVRQRLHAAARRRGLALRFRPGRGPLTFCVEALPASTLAPVAEAITMPDRAPVQPARPLRRRDERRSAGRYDAVLPRWMREEQSVGRGDKRRAK